MKDKKIAILGCGNLGFAILQGLIDSKTIDNANLWATKRNVQSLTHLAKVGVNVTNDNKEAVKNCDIIIFAVKHYKIQEVIDETKHFIDPKKHILVSVATGVVVGDIEKWVKKRLPVFRAMPNTAANIKESLTCICHNEAVDEHVTLIKNLFNKIGITIDVEEELMDSATVLGSSGIAFVLRFIRALTQGGTQIGLNTKVAAQMVNQVVRGAAQLLIEREMHPEFEIDKVTTPDGCTIEGLNEMEHNGFSSSLIKGIVASRDKLLKS